jgi:phage-related protein
LPDPHEDAETGAMSDHISKAEIRKDAVQNTVEAAANTVGHVANIVITAVGDVAKAVGGFGTDVFEIRDAARKAGAEHDPEA